MAAGPVRASAWFSKGVSDCQHNLDPRDPLPDCFFVCVLGFPRGSAAKAKGSEIWNSKALM